MTISNTAYRLRKQHHEVRPWTVQDVGDTVWKANHDIETDDRKLEFWNGRGRN